MENIEKVLQKEIKNLVNFFTLVKEKYKDSQYIFLSERFMNIYKCLEQDYANIRLSNFCLREDFVNTKLKRVYINDINYEFPRKIGLRGKIVIQNCCYNYIDPICIMKIATITEKDKKIAADSNCFMPNKKYLARIKLSTEVSSRQMLESLGLELKLLEDNGYKNVISLLPDFLQNYFRFIIDNQKPLAFYLRGLYTGCYFSEFPDDVTYELLRKTIMDDTFQIFKKETDNSDIMNFLLEPRFGYYSMLHYPLSQIVIEEYENYDLPIIEKGKIKRIGRIENE